MRHPGLALLFFWLAFFPTLAGADAALVEGIVRNLENRQPVAGARVRIGDRTALTDENGDFRLRLALTGRFVVEIDAPGYRDDQRELTIRHGINHLNFALTPRGEEATVFGTVYDRILLTPLPRVEVSLDGVAVRTGEDGQYRFDGVCQGDRRLTAAAAGYRISTRTLAVNTRGVQADIYLVADQDFAQVEFFIYDRVDRRPLPLALVQLAGQRAVSDGEGRCRLENLLPGEHRLSIKADGHARYEETLRVDAGRTRLRVYLEPFDTRQEVEKLRGSLPDPSRKDWQKESLQQTRVESAWPGVEPVHERSLEAIDRDLAPRRQEERRVRREAEERDSAERFLRGAVYLKETGEYLGFISFRLDLTDRQVRDVSLRAEANTRDISLSRGKTHFHRRGDVLKLTLDVDGYRGLAALDLSRPVQRFEIHLYSMDFRPRPSGDQ